MAALCLLVEKVDKHRVYTSSQEQHLMDTRALRSTYAHYHKFSLIPHQHLQLLVNAKAMRKVQRWLISRYCPFIRVRQNDRDEGNEPKLKQNKYTPGTGDLRWEV
jgi:hypothetical protein